MKSLPLYIFISNINMFLPFLFLSDAKEASGNIEIAKATQHTVWQILNFYQNF